MLDTPAKRSPKTPTAPLPPPKHPNPLAEVFGYPADNMDAQAERHRAKKLCPFNNKVPNCTKSKANDPLGVCSVFDGDDAVITCPVRFRQDWIVADQAAEFFGFPDGEWTTVSEISLKDKNGEAAGNIDLVVVRYDSIGRVVDFGAVEVQAVYISGNVGIPFKVYMSDPPRYKDMDWSKKPNPPRPDCLSSSRKRLAPQLIFKGGILHAWGKRQAVVLGKGLFNTLPDLEEVKEADAEIAWLVYDLVLDAKRNQYDLVREKTVYTKFHAALDRITKTEAGVVEDFMAQLQGKLNEKLAVNGDPPPDNADDTAPIGFGA
jgi:hypothetical protein